MFRSNTVKIRFSAILMGFALLAGCATPVPPPPPPVQVAAQIIPPPRPVPPGSAALGMYIPPRGPDGIRRSVNSGISAPQAVWNLRSGLNVAALNCQSPEHQEILPAYSSLLKQNRTKLKRVRDAIMREYRAQYGAKFRDELDGYMTQVYNYFALPPAQKEFCDAARQVAAESVGLRSAEMEGFALKNLPVLDRVFDDFYTRYEQYQADVAAWDAEYGVVQPTHSAGPGEE